MATEILTQYYIEIGTVLLILGLGFGVFYMHNIINRSFGYSFLKTIVQTKLFQNKGAILLEIIHNSGGREFRAAKISPFIKYEILENNNKIEKGVFYDFKALTTINGIPIISCTPNDVRPLDRATGLKVRINPEMITKFTNDLTNDPESKSKQEKLIKQLMWAGVVVLVAVILLVSYMYGNVTDLTAQIISLERELSRTATIITD